MNNKGSETQYFREMAAITKYHRLDVLSETNLLSHISGGWKSRLGCQHVLVLARAFWLADSHRLTVFSRGKRQSKFSGMSPYKVINPTSRVPKASSPNTIILGVRASAYEFPGSQFSLWQSLLGEAEGRCPRLPWGLGTAGCQRHQLWPPLMLGLGALKSWGLWSSLADKHRGARVASRPQGTTSL